MQAYPPRRIAAHERQLVRGLDLHVNRWPGAGSGSQGPHVFLHGFLDVGATFQFLVDDFATERAIVAPDWRGFGRSASSASGYWFPDYLADLDVLLDRYSRDQPAVLVGHSMGGTVAALYAGIRPDRVRALVLLEGLGLKDQPAVLAPERYRKWLDQTRTSPSFRTYPSIEAFAERLCQGNPRLDPARARFLASVATEKVAEGGVRFAADPAHRRANPVLYRRAEAEACWRACRCPVLVLLGAESPYLEWLGSAATPAYLTQAFPDVEVISVGGAGHNLHHDASAACACRIEEFFARIGV